MPDPAAAPLVTTPSNEATEHALAFGTLGSAATAVDLAHPLPTRAIATAAASTPLAGSTAAGAATLGPFLPDLGTTIWLTLSGAWAGSAQVLRSTDGGATRSPLTAGGQQWASYTANAQEPIGEESASGASYYLAVALTSGTLVYRLAQ